MAAAAGIPIVHVRGVEGDIKIFPDRIAVLTQQSKYLWGCPIKDWEVGQTHVSVFELTPSAYEMAVNSLSYYDNIFWKLLSTRIINKSAHRIGHGHISRVISCPELVGSEKLSLGPL